MVDYDGFTQKQKISEHTVYKAKLLKEKISAIDKTLPQELIQFTIRSRDKGAGNWLSALPLEKARL